MEFVDVSKVCWLLNKLLTLKTEAPGCHWYMYSNSPKWNPISTKVCCTIVCHCYDHHHVYTIDSIQISSKYRTQSEPLIHPFLKIFETFLHILYIRLSLEPLEISFYIVSQPTALWLSEFRWVYKNKLRKQLIIVFPLLKKVYAYM